MSRYTFKIYPAGRGREIYRIIKISGKDTLDTLCEFILRSFDFIHEHLYEFCMDNKMYSDDSYEYDPEDGGPSTAWLTDEQVKAFKSDFRYVADYFVQKRRTGKYVGSKDKIKHITDLQ